MTANQIRKALIKANIDMSTIFAIEHNEVEVLVNNARGQSDYDATEAAADAVAEVLGWCCRGTGYGSYVFNKNYRAVRPELEGFADPAHY